MIQTLLIVLGGSAALFLVFWMLAVVVRWVHPDKAIPLDKDQDRVRRIRMKAGAVTTVMFDDIRTLEKSRVMAGDENEDYLFENGHSAGWPEQWWDDLDRRRN